MTLATRHEAGSESRILCGWRYFEVSFLKLAKLAGANVESRFDEPIRNGHAVQSPETDRKRFALEIFCRWMFSVPPSLGASSNMIHFVLEM